MQCLGLTGACAACSHCTATAWELSDLDHSHAATPQRVTRALCAQLLRSDCGDFCARSLAPPAVDLLEALDRCVCTRRACCLFAHVALLPLPLSLFLGVRAPSRFPSVALGSKLLDVAHCSLLHQLFLLCFGFIGANSNSNSMNSIRRAAFYKGVEALLMLPSQGLLLLCHLDNDLVIIIDTL